MGSDRRIDPVIHRDSPVSRDLGHLGHLGHLGPMPSLDPAHLLLPVLSLDQIDQVATREFDHSFISNQCCVSGK